MIQYLDMSFVESYGASKGSSRRRPRRTLLQAPNVQSRLLSSAGYKKKTDLASAQLPLCSGEV